MPYWNVDTMIVDYAVHSGIWWRSSDHMGGKTDCSLLRHTGNFLLCTSGSKKMGFYFTIRYDTDHKQALDEMFCQFCLDSIFHVISWSSCTSRESWGRDLRSKFSNNSARSTWSGAVCRRHSSFSACGAVTPLMPTLCQWPRGNLTWSRVRVLPRTLWKTMHFVK